MNELSCKKLPYLSVSSCNSAYRNPNKFYLNRLSENPTPKDPQGQSAANGTVFDIRVKQYLVDRFFQGRVINDTSLEVTGDMLTRAEKVGSDFFEYYKRTVMTFVPPKFVEIDIDEIFEFRGVPIRIKPDAYVKLPDEAHPLPFDWKVMGSENYVSPYKGYKSKFTGFNIQNPHKIYKPEILMTDINEMWAFQLCVYGWYMFRNEHNFDRTLRPFKGVIHQLTQTSTGTKQVSIYEATIDTAYQEEVAEDFTNLWDELQNGTYVKRLAGRDINLIKMAAEKETWYAT